MSQKQTVEEWLAAGNRIQRAPAASGPLRDPNDAKAVEARRQLWLGNKKKSGNRRYDYSDRFNLALQKLGWTQARLAVRLCVARTTVSAWVNDVNTIPADVLYQVEHLAQQARGRRSGK